LSGGRVYSELLMSIIDQTHRNVFLHPGEMVLAVEPTVAVTVLGSCVSITLFHPRLRVGAICHAILPDGDIATPGKFVKQSVSYMIDQFTGLKINPSELVAKLFGGADMFNTGDTERTSRGVGAQNIREAVKSLRAVDLEVITSDIGGHQGRKLIFYTHTGDVFIKLVKKDCF